MSDNLEPFVQWDNLMVLGITPGDAQALLLAQHSGVTPGNAWVTKWNAGDRTWVVCMGIKLPPC